MKPQFIVIEGLEGVGKSSAIGMIKATLLKAGVKEVVVTRQPGGTPLAERIRKLTNAEKDEGLTIEAELLLFCAARAQLVESLIRPALAAGKWVISDRHELSTRAYQGGGRGIDDSVINQIHSFILKGLKADLSFYLDSSPEIGLQRIKKRDLPFDRLESQELSFFNRVRDRYLSLAKKNISIMTIDAEQPMELVHQDIRKVLKTHYPKLEW